MAKLDFKKLNFIDTEYETIENDEEKTIPLTSKEQKGIVKQIDSEYQLAYSFNEAKRKTWLTRLKLYNNQKRDSNAVGDPLMFTIFNTIHAALWDDRLMVNWEGRGGEGDEDVEENLNALSEYDYDIMGKAEIDYEWNWDAEFFGRGLCLLMDFEREKGVQAPIPEVIDPTCFVRDPRAKSVNGNRNGSGAMRFGGYEIGMTYWELKDNPAYFNLSQLKKDKEIKSTLDDARQARRDAQNLENFNNKEEELKKYENYEFRIWRWFTSLKGQKYMIEMANSRSLIIRMQKLDNKRWPIIDRALYPISHDWDGVTIPDLTEDKQRAKAVLLNLGLDSAKSEVLPNYLFDQTRIKNKNDLNLRTNKFIAVDGRVDNAIMPVQKSTVHQYANLIMEILDTAAQRATATPEIQQGIMSQKQRTLGELELVSSKVDTRYSMSAKLYGLSEANFWRQYYSLYKKHFKDKIDEKIIRISGAFAPVFRPLTRENIIADIDPDVKIESKVISEGKRQRDLNKYISLSQILLQDPNNNRRFIQKRTAKFFGMSKEEIDQTFPPTVDELQAEEENEIMNNDKWANVSIMDDHQTHLSIHTKANPNGKSAAHIRAHKKAMLVKRSRPDLFPPLPEPSFTAPAMKTREEGPAPTTTTQ